jgi:hypothetical protein
LCPAAQPAAARERVGRTAIADVERRDDQSCPLAGGCSSARPAAGPAPERPARNLPRYFRSTSNDDPE